MYDAIIVGARAAGSPTAMLLARKGHRVLVVDRASFPSDTLSTHYIHQPGVARLRRWGLLDRLVAAGCPPSRELVFDIGPFALTGTPLPSDGVAGATRRVAPSSIRFLLKRLPRPAPRCARTSPSTSSFSRRARS
jgi:2-polyprenyl-6-methoxyphenol hydroxylase-like FAD-dependent oxidoreductase